jgi:glycosyltransferase involved in cell wall biosynthesis
MLLIRPFFPRVVFHWHAAGLADWLETSASMRVRDMTYRRMRDADLSVVLSRYNRADAEKLTARRIVVVGNGIPDPCPDFETVVGPRRRARQAARRKLTSGRKLSAEDLEHTGDDPQVFKVLYLALCTREKGLFDTITGILQARRKLESSHAPFEVRLSVAGTFADPSERQEFEEVLATFEGRETIRYLGFVSGDAKRAALLEADLFCFPTYYQNENQPVNLIEALAFGLPPLTTRWRSIPELFPPDYPLLVDIRAPDQVTEAILECLFTGSKIPFRDLFLANFTFEKHLRALSEALRAIEPSPAPDPRKISGADSTRSVPGS